MSIKSSDVIQVSIITVCMDSELFIEDTVKSVIKQKYPFIEYIIVDGKSNDNTLKIINKYKDQIDTVISERDDGIYDAMNKGLDLATGEVIYFLNSGDCLYDEYVIKNIVHIFKANVDFDLVYGYVIPYCNSPSPTFKGLLFVFILRLAYLVRNSAIDFIFKSVKNRIIFKGICHQAIFARRSVLNDCFKFDLTYVVYSDFDWLIRVLSINDIGVKNIDIPIAYYLKGGFSEKCLCSYHNELYSIIKQHLSFSTQLVYFLLHPFMLVFVLRNCIFTKKQRND
jgi:glycosyltransferase involved in cell wall biosynthesis